MSDYLHAAGNAVRNGPTLCGKKVAAYRKTRRDDPDINCPKCLKMVKNKKRYRAR